MSGLDVAPEGPLEVPVKFRDYLGDIAAQELLRLTERVRARSEKLRSKDGETETEEDQDEADDADEGDEDEDDEQDEEENDLEMQ